jgi:uncharacterized protein
MSLMMPPQPAFAPLWFGPLEAGDTRHIISNGYVHVIAQLRGSGKSEGTSGDEKWDHHDTVEWITQQPWSDGKVGMVGMIYRDAERQSHLLLQIIPNE